RARAARVWQLDLSNVFAVGAVRHLASLIAETRADIVHTHLWNADVLSGLAARYARAPSAVSTVRRAYLPRPGSSGWSAVRRPALSRAYRLAYRLFDRVIAVSDYVRRDLAERPGIRVDERVDVIHDGIDVRRIGTGEVAFDDEDRQ